LPIGREEHPQPQVQPLEAQQRIAHHRGEADQVEDAEIHVAHACDGHDDGDDHAQAKNLETAPEKLGVEVGVRAATLSFAAIDERHRHADQQQKRAGGEALPVSPKTFPEHHVGQDAPVPEVPHQVVDDHRNDGDAAPGVDLPEAGARRGLGGGVGQGGGGQRRTPLAGWCEYATLPCSAV
jgi:hypothetical protein